MSEYTIDTIALVALIVLVLLIIATSVVLTNRSEDKVEIYRSQERIEAIKLRKLEIEKDLPLTHLEVLDEE